MHTIIEDGDSLQIRATISDAKELGELIAKLESRRNGWKVPVATVGIAVPSGTIPPDYPMEMEVSYEQKAK